MTEATPPRRLPAWLWPLLLVGVLALALLLEGAVPGDLLRAANPDRSAATGLADAIDAVDQDGMVLVAMDPDLGTYPEIRATVRAAMDQIRGHGARIAVVSYTPEGRAVAAAELERLRAAGAADDRLADLGFLAGAEAALVLSVTDLAPAEGGSLPPSFATASNGIAAFDLVLVVGGVDIGPRTWVEQVSTRVPELPIVAVVPTFMQPEVAPYLRTGQLDGMIATVRDGAAYAEGSAHTAAGASPLAMLVGMLIALAFVGRALWTFRRVDAGGSDLPDEPA
jgi:hypothetical protein